jgi:hypothetical protein
MLAAQLGEATWVFIPDTRRFFGAGPRRTMPRQLGSQHIGPGKIALLEAIRAESASPAWRL